MTNYIVEVDNDNVVRIYNPEYATDKSLPPFILQDIHPEGRAWENKAEAENWGNQYAELLAAPPVEKPLEENSSEAI